MDEEIYQTCLDPAVQILEKLLVNLPYYLSHMKSPMQTMILDLKFFKMFFWGLTFWEESKYNLHLHFATSTMVFNLRQTVKEFKVDYERANSQSQLICWEEMTQDMEKRIQQFKPQVKEICFLILGGTLKCKSCQYNQKLFLEHRREVPCFIDFILQNVKDLLHSNIDLIAHVKQQIEFIQRKLKKFPRVANPINHSIYRVKKLCGLMSHARTWTNHVSCFTCLYWIDGMDDSMAYTAETILSNLMHKTMPYAPGFIASYLEDTTIPQLLASYFDFHFRDLVIFIKNDFEMLHERLIFLLSFVIDPPEDNSDDREQILAQIYAIINKLPSLFRSICPVEMKNGIFKVKFSLFLQKIDKIKAEIRKLYAKIPHSSQFTCPTTNGVGFLDFLVENLKKMLEKKMNLIPILKNQVEIVHKELGFLRPFIQSNMGSKNNHKEFKDLWTQTINVVYYTSYVTNFCPARSFSLWYGIICIPNVIADIRLIKIRIQKMKDHHMYEKQILCAKMDSNTTISPQAMPSKIEGAFVGFKEDIELIINYLMRGQQYLTIISISGLPGQGKTTLAKRIYDDPKIQYHFQEIVWCYVSKECKARELLIKIGCDLIGVGITNLEFEDVAERLRKILKKKRYLIVMDDIWDVAVWNQVRISFPDDRNGSRILFTSRNDDLASQTKLNSISHRLRLFSEKESWELMKDKLFFGYSGAPPEFLKTAQLIASYCKGLPLAIVLISSLLQRTEQKLDLWDKVAENLKSHLVTEGCGNIIELSYKYLPDHLKSCFLYFGAFPRGENIRAKKLKQLWIAEGFIKDNGMQHLEDLANEYLNDLISQNLVSVAERSSMGGIKTCNVHDLLYDLCLEKAVEENFLDWVETSTIIDQCDSSPQKYTHHRLCIGRFDAFIKPIPISTIKELPTSQVHSLSLSDYSLRTLNDFISGFLKSFKVLTVLDLERVRLKHDKFPEVILSIIHLRYLALWGDDINCIPSSIVYLWNLETLIVRGWRFCDMLPVSMVKMKILRHVDLPLTRLNLEDIEKNNYFEAYNIETLGRVRLVCDSKTEEFFRKLPRLRKLDSCFDEKEYNPTWFSMFGSLKKLESLRIKGLSFICWKKLPTFNFPKLENLKRLTLSTLHLPWNAISIIGKELPNLQVLKLLYNGCQGYRWILKDGDFLKLRYLKLSELPIRHIDVSGCEDIPFPCLEQVVVEFCYNLKEIPSTFGEIYSLKTIKMISCPYEVTNSVKQILKNQRDMGNIDLQVFVKEDYKSGTYKL